MTRCTCAFPCGGTDCGPDTTEAYIAKLEQQLLDTQHELAILHDTYKLYPGAWCCNAARFSNGWNHAESCKNWVLKF